MSNLTAAKSQKAEDRPISFILDAKGIPAKSVDLFIRPEDISIGFPSRLSVNQTLGGAWVDSFGEGLQMTTISGTLGWRTGPDGKDGFDRLIDLKKEFYTNWHDLRAKSIKAGDDPGNVQLRYVDTLNRYSRVVVPQIFEVKRSKSRPLLGMYRFAFISVANPAPAPAPISQGASGFSLSSLVSSIKKITTMLQSVKKFIDASILAPVRAFMNLTGQVLSAVKEAIAAGFGIAKSLVDVAQSISQSGTNIFRTLSAVMGIPGDVKSALMQVAGAYSNAFCVIRNSLPVLPTYEDYRALYGASNCSSTGGGLPASVYANQNAFAAVAVHSAVSVSISPVANRALEILKRSDVVIAPFPSSMIGSALKDISAGVLLR